MTSRESNQVLCNVWSYNFYHMTLRHCIKVRHMINMTFIEDLTLVVISWTFHMKFMKQAFGEFHKFHLK